MVMSPYLRWPRKSELGLVGFVMALAMEEIRQVRYISFPAKLAANDFINYRLFVNIL